MANTSQKIKLSPSRDIPFNKLVLSQSNVRQTKAGVSIEQLAESIAQRTLLQSLNVRAIRDVDGSETGMYEVPAGGRRYRALELLVKQKRMAKSQPVPCVVREGGIAEDDSLAENDERVGLHPLDQFRAFKVLKDGGMSEADIAARHFVSETVVKQRLRLASVSPKLLDLYAADELTLEQLMAFAVSDDHARQEQVWENASQSGHDEPYHIRGMLTENTVPASDRRARFVGLKSYEATGGSVIRDLFDEDEDGYLQDVPLLERLVTQKLKAEAETIAAEGWKWINIATSFPFGHTNGLREIQGEPIDMTADEEASLETLRAEYEQIEAEYQDADEYPAEVDRRLGEIEKATAGIEDRPYRFDPTEVGRAGVFVSLDSDGDIVVDRGYVRPEDESARDPSNGDSTSDDVRSGGAMSEQKTAIFVEGSEPEDDDELVKPLPERLVMELTAHRTLALQNAVAGNARLAMTALLHKLARDAFHSSFATPCLEASIRRVHFPVQGSDLKESAAARQIEERHEAWEQNVPKDDADLWDWIEHLDDTRRAALLAHCVAYGVNAVHEKVNPQGSLSSHGLKQRLEQADRIARAAGLDMVQAGWTPTVENYLGRVSKARILEAVQEAKGDSAVQLIDHLKKGDMAKEAERLLQDSGWLPEPLRLSEVSPALETDAAHDALPDFLDDEAEDSPATAEAAE